MKLTNLDTVNGNRIEFNDLGTYIKGVSPQPLNMALDMNAAVYLPDSGEVMYSCQSGDAKRYAKAGLAAINETVAFGAGDHYVINHNFGFLPRVTVAEVTGTGVNTIYTDWSANAAITVVTNAALTQTTITSASAVSLHIRIS